MIDNVFKEVKNKHLCTFTLPYAARYTIDNAQYCIQSYSMQKENTEAEYLNVSVNKMKKKFRKEQNSFLSPLQSMQI